MSSSFQILMQFHLTNTVTKMYFSRHGFTSLLNRRAILFKTSPWVMRGHQDKESYWMHKMTLQIYAEKSLSSERSKPLVKAIVPPFMCFLPFISSLVRWIKQKRDPCSLCTSVCTLSMYAYSFFIWCGSLISYAEEREVFHKPATIWHLKKAFQPHVCYNYLPSTSKNVAGQIEKSHVHEQRYLLGILT